MKERRNAERHDVDLRVHLFIDEKEVNCTLRNMSNDGALLMVAEEDLAKISSQDTAKEVTFQIISSQYRGHTRFKGKIVRVLMDNNVAALALRIFQM